MRQPLIWMFIVGLSISLDGVIPPFDFAQDVVSASRTTPPSLQDASEAHLGQRGEHGADLCDLLPDSSGKAEGLDKLCPPDGSSGGVARGDFNGDGFADLAVGVPFEDLGTEQDAGAVHVIYGSTNGLTTGGGTSGVPAAQFWHQDVSDPVLGGVKGAAEDGDLFGAALAAGNFNGDDFSDLAVGAPGEEGSDYTGVVHILYGTANGLTASAEQKDDQLFSYNDAGFLHEIPPGDTKFGEALVWGDFDGDDIGDLAVGMPGAAGSCHILGCTNEAGRVVILYGLSPGGLSTTDHQVVLQNTYLLPPANFLQLGDGNEEGDRFGSVLAAGDFDNDTFDDLVIGVPKEDFEGSIFGPFVINHGVVEVAFGSEDGITSLNNFRLSRCEEGCQFGRALAVGDFNGDGFADLAAAAPFADVGSQNNAGRVYVIDGEADDGLGRITTLDQDTDGILGGAEPSDHFGKALAAGDFNGDGRSDLAIGVPDENLPDAGGVDRADAGGVHIIYGSDNGLSSSGDQFFDQDDLGPGRSIEAGDQFGAALTAWNFGRNETLFGLVRRTADLAIAAPGENLLENQVSDAGAVTVLYGQVLFPRGLQATGNQFWHQNLVPGGTGDATINEAGDLIEASDQFGRALY